MQKIETLQQPGLFWDFNNGGSNKKHSTRTKNRTDMKIKNRPSLDGAAEIIFPYLSIAVSCDFIGQYKTWC